MDDTAATGMLIMCAFLFVAGCFVGSWHSDNYWERATINRGLALYCPTDSYFAFSGECK